MVVPPSGFIPRVGRKLPPFLLTCANLMMSQEPNHTRKVGQLSTATPRRGGCVQCTTIRCRSCTGFTRLMDPRAHIAGKSKPFKAKLYLNRHVFNSRTPNGVPLPFVTEWLASSMQTPFACTSTLVVGSQLLLTPRYCIHCRHLLTFR